MNLVDTSGWLEYFADGRNARLFAGPIEDIKNLIVSTININEVFKKVLMEKDEISAIQAVSILQQGKVIPVDSSISVYAAKISFELKIPMADSIILATARDQHAAVWTQDVDFKGLPGVKYIRKRM